MGPKLYKKKPVVIEALQWTGDNHEAILEFCSQAEYHTELFESGTMFIRTLEGKMQASVNDYIIRGLKGEFYPCKPDIFQATYDPVINV